MKCDKCDREAVVHEIVQDAGSLVEKHLCEVHAAEIGIESTQPTTPVHELFKIALASGKSAKQVLACGHCGTTYTEFQNGGLLGCAECYSAFEARLGPLLERAHEGAVHHVGKVPKRALDAERDQAREDPPPLSVSDRARLLRARLEQAVHKEDYEQAARLRDELADLQQGGSE